MKALSSLLARYSRLTPPNVVIRDSMVVLMKKRFSYEITREQVKVQGRVVYIDCPALVKNEISINKQELMNELLRTISPHVVDDIR